MEVISRDPQIVELERWIERIWDTAVRLGLDPYPTHFEIVPATIMYEFGSYGLPGRFSHWTHGRAYHQMKTMYDYGLNKIYELVINSNPCYAFLMEANTLLENKLVVAHVLAHSDFFRHNAYFQHTNRQMVETASINAERIRRYEYDHGTLEVERFLDAVLSIEDHVELVTIPGLGEPPEERDERPRPRTTPYDDLFELDRRGGAGEPAGPGEEGGRGRSGAGARREGEWRGAHLGRRRRFPREPQRDLLKFILEHAEDLEDWQRDIIAIVRQERLYFVPQLRTKTLNEGWACATGESLLATERGFVRFCDLYEKGQKIAVGSGGTGALHRITDFHKETHVPTIRITTSRGYTIEGAFKHRVRLPNGSWAYLCDLRVGDRVDLAIGTDVWPSQPVLIDFVPAMPSVCLNDVAQSAGTSVWTVIRHRAGRTTRSGTAIAEALRSTAYTGGWAGHVLPTRHVLKAPKRLTESLAYLLGYFVGDGNVTKSGICLTCGDKAHAHRLGMLVTDTLGIPATVRDDATSTGPRWRIEVHARELLRLLRCLGVDLSARARHKSVPESVLHSPKEVVAAFLRGYFDADGYAGPAGVILSSASTHLAQTVQIILLNFGILCSRRSQPDGCQQLQIRGASARRFHEQIGFDLERKRAALNAYVQEHQWFEREETSDEIVAIEQGCADVFDITVDEAHTYVANGFVNHNSLWHSRILRELDLPEGEHTEFARLHASVAAPSRHQLNPYYVGMRMLEHIERRWENPSPQDRERLGLRGGEGRAKLFEVRELENDLSFMRTYLTKEIVEDLDLYIYAYEGGEWRIVEKNWEKVRDQIVRSLTSYGIPYITVEDGDYRRARELLLKHHFDGDELDVRYAERTLRYVYQLWGRPVHLETVIDDKPVLLSYDGSRNTKTAL